METKEVRRLCRKYGVPASVVRQLIKEGFNKEEIEEILVEADW